MKNIFIIGSKGIPAKYGGFETFVENLTLRKKNESIKYHISCLSNEKGEFYYNNARCFKVKVPNIGSAKAVIYDILSLEECINYIEKNKLDGCIIYILACRIGPFLSIYKKKLKKLNIKVFINPDGHEWKRSKWNYFVKKYWKFSEKIMVKNSELIICDSRGIEDYIKYDYKQFKPETTFIAYGADITKSLLNDDDQNLQNWYGKFGINKFEYYLVVGRFVPENNYELIISEFMNSETKKELVIITNVEKNDFYENLKRKTGFLKDSRIKFVGTVYDQEMLKKIREQAFGYIHGHEVGGTNPSLLEALASTKVNLLLCVNFNKEVGEDGARYFMKKDNSLSTLIDELDLYSKNQIDNLSILAKKRIIDDYSWDEIVKEYENLFLKS